MAGLVLQLTGIIVAFSDLSDATGFGPNARRGTPIMAAGTGLHALSLTYFLILFGVVIFRATMAHRHYGYTTFHPHYGFVAMTRKFKIILVVIVASCIVLFVRAIFQIILLAAGFESDIAKNEGLYLGFNGFLVAEPIVGLIIAHPSSFLQDGIKQKKRNLEVSASELFDSRFGTSPSLPYTDRSNIGSFWEVGSLDSSPRRPPRSTVASFWEVGSSVCSSQPGITGSHQGGQVFSAVPPGSPRTPRTPVNGQMALEWNRARNLI